MAALRTGRLFEHPVKPVPVLRVAEPIPEQVHPAPGAFHAGCKPVEQSKKEDGSGQPDPPCTHADQATYRLRKQRQNRAEREKRCSYDQPLPMDSQQTAIPIDFRHVTVHGHKLPLPGDLPQCAILSQLAACRTEDYSLSGDGDS